MLATFKQLTGLDAMRTKQRLVVCLDGTWNNKDDSTNVIHHFALSIERPWPDPSSDCRQLRYYDEGVGTGVLDGITGGGFGFGLEENVRAAYDWLVEHYHDADESGEADEIYIFGFSRGAYTARSLVGFISTCGLLRRGAPLSVNQLWQEYCLLGRQRESRTSFWDKIFGEDRTNIRRINGLVVDPWNVKRFEEKRREANKADTGAQDRVPGQLRNDLNSAERLLVRWSRRVRITYLGIYDTVGAVGVDALAIPGVKSKLAMHHNLRTTTLVQQCRHALALDEHRSSFNHTPLVEFVGHGLENEDHHGSSLSEQDAATHWARERSMWERKIEQRWFAGAHSNIGGGYPDNELAQFPFQWLLEGAQHAGLECEGISFVPPTTMPKPRDSYSEFAKPFWTEVIRGKRFYRQIDPVPEMRASVPKTEDDGQPLAGFSLQSIHEQIDATALDWAASEQEYLPPNLWEYAQRKLQADPNGADSPTLRPIADKTPQHAWLGSSFKATLILVLWATFAAAGLAAMNELFLARRAVPPLWLLCGTAFVFALVDWLESWSNFWLAVDRTRVWRRALFDSIYWLRTLGFVLFVAGCTTALVRLWGTGWYAETFADAGSQAWEIIKLRWKIPVAAGVGIVIANILDMAPKKRQIAGWLGGLAGLAVAAIVIVPLVILLARLFGYVCTPAFGHPHATDTPPATDAKVAGLLILLQFGFGYFFNALTWVGEPMTRANLGSIVRLQFCWTPNAVSQRLESWRTMLACRWNEADKDVQNGPAARALRETLREALWRDIFGYIPVYSGVFGFGLWFGAHELGWQWLGQEYLALPLWLLLPLVAAIADWIEDACHLSYVALHQRGQQPPIYLTLLSGTMTQVKFLALIIAAFPSAAALVMGTFKVMGLAEKTGWRGTVALLISAATLLLTAAVVLSAAIYRLRNCCQKRERNTSDRPDVATVSQAASE